MKRWKPRLNFKEATEFFSHRLHGLTQIKILKLRRN
jgi:hypothetical protein